MKSDLQKNKAISLRLEHVLNQLEHVTNYKGKTTKTPAQEWGGGKKEKDFPRILGNA